MNTNNITVRAETVKDYTAITAVEMAAFGERVGEALVVMLQRERADFNPALSLVAELDGKVVGHVLFTPHQVRLLGETVQAVNLAPIAVDPMSQKSGIGKLLIEEGHRIAREKGYAFSFLLGHPTYYPRFGYLTGTYGFANLKLAITRIEYDLIVGDIKQADIAEVYRIWEEVEGTSDFALNPGTALLDWLSPSPLVESRVYRNQSSQLVGYTRINKNRPANPIRFLARDEESARQIASHLANTYNVDELVLPLHPTSKLAQVLGNSQVTTTESAMVCPLMPSPFDRYYLEVKNGNRVAGSPIWSTAFDLD
jgi:predicted N-acetyltransferase YhbS